MTLLTEITTQQGRFNDAMAELNRSETQMSETHTSLRTETERLRYKDAVSRQEFAAYIQLQTEAQNALKARESAFRYALAAVFKLEHETAALLRNGQLMNRNQLEPAPVLQLDPPTIVTLREYQTFANAHINSLLRFYRAFGA